MKLIAEYTEDQLEVVTEATKDGGKNMPLKVCLCKRIKKIETAVDMTRQLV